MSEPTSILCLSHLTWDPNLFQRPQQIMTRLARRGHRVFYVSKLSTRQWIQDAFRGRNGIHASPPDQNPAHRNSPWFPLSNRIGLVREMDERFLSRRLLRWANERPGPLVLWLYHPCYLRFVDRIPHEVLVYDIMDHFKGFKLSKRDVRSIEEELLGRADVVTTGGRAIQEANESQRPDARCFPSGIELEHFSMARDPDLAIPEDMRGIPGPVLGYFGAIDERLDFDLVRSMCRAHREWSVVFLGPVIPGTELTIDEPNFHWLGPKPYAELPAYLKAWDVCLMPWVQSELTAHISPTKTPEYLAGGKPVASVPIRDVRRDYGDVVFFGEGAEGFSEAVEAALEARGRDWAATLEGREAARTWDQIAEAMEELIAAANTERGGGN